MPIDRELIGTWLTGWARARRVSQPVDLGDCWRVEIGWPSQRMRYVFARPSPELSRLAQATADPLIFLKAFVAVDEMAALLPPGRWVVEPQCGMMVLDALEAPPAASPPDYRLQQDGGMVSMVFGGDKVAEGLVVKEQGLAVFVGIKVDPAHRRRSLGRAVVGALTAMARDLGAERGALVATQEGQALYRAMGWRDYAPYASAHPDIQR